MEEREEDVPTLLQMLERYGGGGGIENGINFFGREKNERGMAPIPFLWARKRGCPEFVGISGIEGISKGSYQRGRRPQSGSPSEMARPT
jgi:hypothetical protein